MNLKIFLVLELKHALASFQTSKSKVHIFWESHTILRNLQRRFDRYYSEYMNFNQFWYCKQQHMNIRIKFAWFFLLSFLFLLCLWQLEWWAALTKFKTFLLVFGIPFTSTFLYIIWFSIERKKRGFQVMIFFSWFCSKTIGKEIFLFLQFSLKKCLLAWQNPSSDFSVISQWLQILCAISNRFFSWKHSLLKTRNSEVGTQ